VTNTCPTCQKPVDSCICFAEMDQPKATEAPSGKRFDMPLSDAYEWIESGTKKPVSEFGKAVATILGRAWAGIYHLESVLKADWSSERMVEVSVFGDLSNLGL